MKISKRNLKILIESYLLAEAGEGKTWKYSKDQETSDEFRGWMIDNYPKESKSSDIDITRRQGSSTWDGLHVAYEKFGKEFEKSRNEGEGGAGLFSVAAKMTAAGAVKLLRPLLAVIGQENFISQLFFDFVEMRTAPITENSITTSIADCLRIIAADAVKHKLTDKPGGWGSQKDYNRVANSEAYIERFGEPSKGNYNMAENMKGNASIVDSFVSKDPLNNIFNTFTHLTVSVKDDKIFIKDKYDFNPAVNILGKDDIKKGQGVSEDPKFFQKEENFKKFLSAAAQGKLMIYRYEKKGGAKWRPEDFLSRAAIENLCRFYEGLFGYSGIPIDIELNKESPNATLGTLWDIGAYATDALQSLTFGGANTIQNYASAASDALFGDDEEE